MTTRTRHVFFPYPRADNGEDNNHFIIRLHDLLCKERPAITGRELNTFFDTGAIDDGEHWKHVWVKGCVIRDCSLALLSATYLRSEVCLKQ